MEELIRTIAQIFRHTGKGYLNEKEFKLTVSMDLKWFSPNESLELLSTARKAGLLKKKRKGFSPNFNISEEEVPLDFKPSKKVLKLPQTPLFTKIVEAVVKNTDQEKSAVVARINRKQEKLNIDVRVAALMVARESGADITPFLEETEEHMIRTYGLPKDTLTEEEE